MRLTDTQHYLLMWLSQAQPEERAIGYDDLAEAVGVNRRTCFSAMRGLIRRHLVAVERGRGARPNRYDVLLGSGGGEAA